VTEEIVMLVSDHPACTSSWAKIISLPFCADKNYYAVPNRRVQGLVGRKDVLDKGFSSGSTPHIVVIRGLGG
jgi:hypothetical protein